MNFTPPPAMAVRRCQDGGAGKKFFLRIECGVRTCQLLGAMMYLGLAGVSLLLGSVVPVVPAVLAISAGLEGLVVVVVGSYPFMMTPSMMIPRWVDMAGAKQLSNDLPVSFIRYSSRSKLRKYEAASPTNQ